MGKSLPNIEMKLIDENGKDVTDEGRGELCVKGPNVMKGYFENEKARKDSWDDEAYLRTGDMIRIDKSIGLNYVLE